MKLIKSTSLLVAAVALVALSASDAAAQGGPTITSQQTGGSLRVDWTAVAGATSYDIVVSGALNGQVNIPTNFLVVAAPAGTYVMQVRGRNGATVGPFSDATTIVVGGGAGSPGGCSPVDAPTIAVSVANTTVNVSWAAVPGAAGYLLQVGMSPGATQFQVQLPASQTSYANSIPVLGTFYVRVLAGNACTQLTPSAEQSFTIGAPTPGPSPNPNPGGGGGTTGNRTPNPTLTNGGVQCLPGRPDLGVCIPISSLGYANGVVNQVAAANGGDVRNSCRAEGGNMNFIFKAVSALRRIDTRWALNMKRGNQGESEDIVAFNPTDRPDNGESQVYLFDVIGGHCGPNPTVNGLSDVTGGTWAAGLANTPGCSTRFCAAWTLDAYLRAGFQP